MPENHVKAGANKCNLQCRISITLLSLSIRTGEKLGVPAHKSESVCQLCMVS